MERATRELREEVEGLGPRGQGFRYPADLQRRLTEEAGRLRARGWSTSEMEEALSMRWDTLRRWLSCAEQEEAMSPQAALIPVQILSGKHLLAVISPTGYRVEGLDVEQVAVLLRALS